MRSLVRLFFVVAIAGIGAAAIALAAIPQLVALAEAHQSDSSIPELNQLAQRSVIFDSGGGVLITLRAEENRKPVTLDLVSKPAIDAVLAVEDEHFYDHSGVNVRSILRATLANVSAGQVVQGGSTITQQLVKNALLSSKRDTNRKITEAMYALRLEKELTKDQILERYLNTIYFGNGAYGIQAAAEVYFGHDANTLTLTEGGFIAGLIRNPVGYDPFQNPQDSRNRRRQVLDRLVALGKMTKDEAAAADRSPLPIKPLSTSSTEERNGYFAEAVKQELLSAGYLGDNPQQRYNAVFRGGLKVYTTYDPRLQQLAEQARTQVMPYTGGRFEAALASVEPATGAIRAQVGGPGFEQWKYDLSLRSNRQTGSSFKTFVLVAALEAGVQPNDLIDGTAPCAYPNPGGTPNPFVVFGENGGVGPLDQMTWESINCAYTRLGQIVGIKRVIAVARKMGITAPIGENLSVAIGDVGVSPMEMASAYATLAAGGIRRAPYRIERVETQDGKVIFQHVDQPKQVIAPDVAARATQVLTTVVTRGTGVKARLTDRPSAGKTGTDDLYQNAWFVGFTPQLSTAVWMGNPRIYETMKNIGDVRGGITGGSFPARIWHQFMQSALAGQPIIPFGDPGALKRGAARLFLPGVECVQSAPTTVAVDPLAPSTAPRATTTWKPRLPTTIAGQPIDPSAPVATAPIKGYVVFSCAKGPPSTTAASTTTTAGTTTTGPPSTESSTTVSDTTTAATTTTPLPTTTILPSTTPVASTVPRTTTIAPSG